MAIKPQSFVEKSSLVVEELQFVQWDIFIWATLYVYRRLAKCYFVATAGCSMDVDQQQQAAAGTAPVDDNKRFKNRSAARRCREKRLERQRVMRREVTDVGAENSRLQAKIRRHQDGVDQLRSLLTEHRLGLQCCLNGLATSADPSFDTSMTLDFDEPAMGDLGHW